MRNERENPSTRQSRYLASDTTVNASAYSGTDSLNLLAAAVTANGIQVLSTTWKSTDGTASHWKYILGYVIVYRDVYRGRSTPHLGGQVRRHVDLYRRPATEL